MKISKQAIKGAIVSLMRKKDREYKEKFREESRKLGEDIYSQLLQPYQEKLKELPKFYQPVTSRYTRLNVDVHFTPEPHQHASWSNYVTLEFPVENTIYRPGRHLHLYQDNPEKSDFSAKLAASIIAHATNILAWREKKSDLQMPSKPNSTLRKHMKS